MRDTRRCRSLLFFRLLVAFALAGAGGGGAQEVVTPSQQPDTVKTFALALTGDVAPAREIGGAATGLGLTFSVVVDPVRREIFVGDFGGDAIRVFPLDADGDVAPLRVIAGAATLLQSPIGLAIDRRRQELFVKPFGSNTVLVFPLQADGNVAPSRVLTSAVVLDNNSRAVAVDPVHGELFVSNQQDAGSIHVFPVAAAGVTVPTRTITGPATGLVEPGALALDIPHQELLVLANGNVLTFGLGQSGNAPPTRSFNFSIAYGAPAGIDLDAVPDELVIGGQSSNGHLLVFPRTTTGAGAVPLRDITGPATGLVFNTMPSVVPTPLFADGFEGDWLVLWSAVQP